MFAREVVPIGERVTAVELRAELVTVGARLLVDSLTAGLGAPQPQRGEPLYAAKIDPAELRIDWSRPAVEIDRLVRLGGAWSTLPVEADQGRGRRAAWTGSRSHAGSRSTGSRWRAR